MACCTHAVLSGPAYERLSNGYLDELVVKDTIKSKLSHDKIKIISASKMIGEAIRRVYNHESINDIFIK